MKNPYTAESLAPCRLADIAFLLTNLTDERETLRAALARLIEAAQRMDLKLLHITGSPRECEQGDIERARIALAYVAGVAR